MDAVYLLWAAKGEYDDRREWPLHAYGDESSAQWAANRLNELWSILRARREELSEGEAEDAYLADDYDWLWAAKAALDSKEGREFTSLYGSKDGDCSGLLDSAYDLSVSAVTIPVRPIVPGKPPTLHGAIAAALKK